MTAWFYRCPENHTSLQMSVNTFQCRSCEESYPKDELVDLRKPGVA